MSETPEFKEANRQAAERRRALMTPELHQRMTALLKASILRALKEWKTAFENGTLMIMTRGPDGKRIATPVNPSKDGQGDVED
jgi:hypothetical protein